VSGEHANAGEADAVGKGSSPRERGAPSLAWLVSWLVADHPRVSGEHVHLVS
jgi:hypothetical protein